VLRGELGFDGLVVTDAIEMAAVSKPYGLAGAAVRALAAGADAICVGGETADEETAIMLRYAIVDAVAAGTLTEGRLAAAAERVWRLADWSASLRRPDAAESTSSLSGVPSGLAVHAASAPLQPVLSASASPRPVLSASAPLAPVLSAAMPLPGVAPVTAAANGALRGDRQVPGMTELPSNGHDLWPTVYRSVWLPHGGRYGSAPTACPRCCP
jgi:beta-N-acetylhexosaminidase